MGELDLRWWGGAVDLLGVVMAGQDHCGFGGGPASCGNAGAIIPTGKRVGVGTVGPWAERRGRGPAARLCAALLPLPRRL